MFPSRSYFPVLRMNEIAACDVGTRPLWKARARKSRRAKTCTPFHGAARSVLVKLRRQVQRPYALFVEEVHELVAVLAGAEAANSVPPPPRPP